MQLFSGEKEMVNLSFLCVMHSLRIFTRQSFSFGCFVYKLITSMSSSSMSVVDWFTSLFCSVLVSRTVRNGECLRLLTFFENFQMFTSRYSEYSSGGGEYISCLFLPWRNLPFLWRLKVSSECCISSSFFLVLGLKNVSSPFVRNPRIPPSLFILECRVFFSLSLIIEPRDAWTSISVSLDLVLGLKNSSTSSVRNKLKTSPSLVILERRDSFSFSLIIELRDVLGSSSVFLVLGLKHSSGSVLRTPRISSKMSSSLAVLERRVSFSFSLVFDRRNAWSSRSVGGKLCNTS